MSLSTTVQKLRNQDSDRRALAADRNAFLTQWRRDVVELYGQFQKALAPFVADNAARIIQTITSIEEDLLGEYDIEALVIEIIDRRIFLMPKARMVTGATGRIDLYREDRPSERNRVILLRGGAGAQLQPDVWLIQDRRESSSPIERAIESTAMTMANLLQRPRFRVINDVTIQESIDFVLNV